MVVHFHRFLLEYFSFCVLPYLVVENKLANLSWVKNGSRSFLAVSNLMQKGIFFSLCNKEEKANALPLSKVEISPE